VALLATPARAGDGRPPHGKALRDAVEAYLDADFAGRRRLRERWDAELAPLKPSFLPRLRKDLLSAARKHGPRLETKGRHWFYGEGRGKYIVSGHPGKALFLGLHGGGAGVGDAESAASAMGGGGWLWIFPEVLKKTEHGWTDAGTEKFVLDLIQAAKRTFKLDPNRIFLTGHSMGGYGTWTIGAHHADLFAGLAPYAGAPTCVTLVGQDAPSSVAPGILPNLYNVPLHVYQSGDDRNVPPVSNDLACKLLGALHERHPHGFEFRYERVDGRGHAAPKEGYLPSLEWIASHDRVPRPRTFLWQPVLGWKRQFYWVRWERPELGAILQVRALAKNRVEITTLEGSGDVSGLSVLLGKPLVDPAQPVTVVVNGRTAFQGPVAHTFSTLLLTLPALDDDLLFDARVDL
jgi:predicted esterase